MSPKRYRVVCIDDDRDTRDMMQLWLAHACGECDVETIETFTEALDSLNRNDADLYVIDSSVRGIEPLTLLQTIREKDSLTPILVFSGMVKRIDRDDAFAAGANDYLTKPADSEDFISAVERLLQRGK